MDHYSTLFDFSWRKTKKGKTCSYRLILNTVINKIICFEPNPVGFQQEQLYKLDNFEEEPMQSSCEY